MKRESMEFDVVIVGAGPSGLATAIRLAQQAEQSGSELSICIVEKGSEVGAHILSGGVMESAALSELIPDWQEKGAPLNQPVTEDATYLLRSESSSIKLPDLITPKTMHNKGNYIVSLGNLCRWLAEQAEGMGIEIFPALVITAVIVMVYIVIGGAHADILTDGVQGALMLLLALAVTVMFFNGFGVEGGYDGMIRNLDEQDPDLLVLKTEVFFYDPEP